MKTPFLGPAYQARSPTLANNQAINIFAEIVEATSGTGSEVGGFYSRPGLDLFMTVGTGPIRGMLTTDAGLFFVSGDTAYAYSVATGLLTLGTLTTAAAKVSIMGNPSQICFVDSQNVYVFSVSTGFIVITIPFSNPGTGVYQDGFGVINEVGTYTMWQSNLNDFTVWDPLNFDTEDGSSEDIVTLAQLHEQIVVLKELHVAFWINAGNSGFVFQRIQGVYLQRGCAAPASIANIGESIIWLGQGAEGQGVVYMATGYEAERVSTFAIEYQIAQYATIADAWGFAYLQEGHLFYVLNFPTANATWVFDLTATQKMKTPMWFQWGTFSGGQINRWAPQVQALVAGQVIVGDYANGNLYILDMNTLTDNGAPKKCLRSWRATGQAAFATEKCNYLDLHCDTGLQVPPGTNPQYILRQSTDGGLSWSAEMYRSAGETGAVAKDVRWNRLGATRRGLNNDRIFELSTTDPFKVGWLGAEIG